LERDLERGLLEHLRSLILELGKGFAFVGSQYRSSYSKDGINDHILAGAQTVNPAQRGKKAAIIRWICKPGKPG
jgi:hypothetical protein